MKKLALIPVLMFVLVTTMGASMAFYYFDASQITSGTLDADRLDGVIIKFADGAASTPSVTFESDTNTGIYLGGADLLHFVTGGVISAICNASHNWTFGAGATDLASTLCKVYIDASGATGSGVRILLGNNDNGINLYNATVTGVGSILYPMSFYGRNTGGNSQGGGYFRFKQTGIASNAIGSEFSIYTASSNGAGNAIQAFIINDSQNVTLGPSDQAGLEVKQHVEGIIRSGGTIAGTASAGSSGFSSKIYAYANGASLPLPASGYMNEVWWTNAAGKFAKVAVESDGTTHEIYLEL